MPKNHQAPPGDRLRQVLARRSWTQQDLAAVTGKPLAAINQVIKGKRAITPEMALSLESALGIPAEKWLEDEYLFRLSLLTGETNDTNRRAEAFRYAPVKDMQKRGWIPESDSVQDLEQNLRNFYEVDSLSIPPPIVANARSSFSEDDLTSAQIAWCTRASQIAKTLSAQSFDEENFLSGLPKLRELSKTVDSIGMVPQLLAEIGVRFVIVEHLPRTKIDGAAFWLSEKKPVIAMSLRYDRIDAFWHTLTHELSHIRNKDAFSPDSDLTSAGEEGKPKSDFVEARADREGAEMLVPKEQLDFFILRVKPFYSKQKIQGFANRIGVHPGIVVGQLQHRREITFKQHRDLLSKAKGALLPNVVCDGWGYTPVF